MTSRMALFVHRAILQTYKRLVVQQLVVAVTVLSCAQLDRAELLEHRKQAFHSRKHARLQTHTHIPHTRTRTYMHVLTYARVFVAHLHSTRCSTLTISAAAVLGLLLLGRTCGCDRL
jgi:hypothetical protein